ncbi:hypothetical protein JW865_03065 [Candidatus Bathyarchaeota archaeon]|nr:hypothetical protein [Candidatus Bathyarchaeota archaeon]
MEERRSKLDLYLEILKSINLEIHQPTKIQYNIKVSYYSFELLITDHFKRGLVIEHKLDKRTSRGDEGYYLTSKGKETMQKFKQ